MSSSKPAATKSSGYYLDDGPQDNPPANLHAVADAVPRVERLHRYANRPYVVLGKYYVPDTSFKPYREVGLASWYGRRFHGKPTASGELYDMYAMTAAHRTLPIPSYARVTSLETGKSVVVRINDRGPFDQDHLIDLSYAAAFKLGFVAKGSARVIIEHIDPSSGSGDSQDEPLKAGHYVHLGVFTESGNAKALLTRARENLSLAPELAHIVLVDDRYHVRLGPFQCATEADNWANRSRKILGVETLAFIHLPGNR